MPVPLSSQHARQQRGETYIRRLHTHTTTLIAFLATSARIFRLVATTGLVAAAYDAASILSIRLKALAIGRILRPRIVGRSKGKVGAPEAVLPVVFGLDLFWWSGPGWGSAC